MHSLVFFRREEVVLICQVDEMLSFTVHLAEQSVIPGETSSRPAEQRVLMASSPCGISSFSSSNSGYDCQEMS